MDDFVALATKLSDLGATVLIVAAAVWFAFKYIPNQMQHLGELTEIIRQNSEVINHCVDVLEDVSKQDSDVKEALNRIESSLEKTRKEIQDIKKTNERRE